MTAELQDAKQVVLEYYDAFDAAPVDQLVDVLRKHTTDDYFWRGIHPFYEQSGEDVLGSASPGILTPPTTTRRLFRRSQHRR